VGKESKIDLQTSASPNAQLRYLPFRDDKDIVKTAQVMIPATELEALSEGTVRSGGNSSNIVTKQALGLQ